MQTEAETDHDLMSTARPTARREARGSRGGRRSGPRVRANSSLVSLAGTAFTGLLLFGQVAHGDAWETVPASGGGSAALETLHVVFAAGLTVSVLWHLLDRRRPLLALAKRRTGAALQCQLAYVALVGLLAASLATGFAGHGRSQVAHHMGVSVVLAAACAGHGMRRMMRRPRTPQRMSAEARP